MASSPHSSPADCWRALLEAGGISALQSKRRPPTEPDWINNSKLLCVTPGMAGQSVTDYTSLDRPLPINQFSINHCWVADCRSQAFIPGVERKANGLYNMLWPLFALIYQIPRIQSVLMRGQKQLVVDETLNIGAQSCWQGKVDGKFVLLLPNERSSLLSLSTQPFIIHLSHFFPVKGICQYFPYNLKQICEVSN